MLFKRSKHRLMRSVILSFLLYNSSLQPIAPLYAKGIMTVIASVGVLTTLFQQWFIAMFWGYQLKQEIEKEGFALPELTLKEQLAGLYLLKRSLKEYAIRDPVALFKANIDDIKHIFKELGIDIKDPKKFFIEKAQQIEALIQKLEIQLPALGNAGALETAKKMQQELGIQNPIAFLKNNLAIIKIGCAILDNPQKYALLKTTRLLESFEKALAAIELQGAQSRIAILEKTAEAQRTEQHTRELLRCYELLKREKEKQHAKLEQAKKRAAELEAIAQAQRTKEHNEELLQCYELLLRESDKQLTLLQQQEHASKEKEEISWLQKLGKALWNEVAAQPTLAQQPALPHQPLIDLEVEALNKKNAADQQEKSWLSTLAAVLFPPTAPAALLAPPAVQAPTVAEIAKKEDADSMQEQIKNEVLKVLSNMPSDFYTGFFEEDNKKHAAHIDSSKNTLKPDLIDPQQHIIQPAVLPLLNTPSNEARPPSPPAQWMLLIPTPTPAPLAYALPQHCLTCSSSHTPASSSTALIKAH